jgi:ribosome-binding ATPase
MKIAFTGLDLPEGKIKYDDHIFLELVKKFEPAKQSPYYFELFPNRYDDAQAIVISEERILDLLILDLEKVETRLSHTETEIEKGLLERCQIHLEAQKPLCDMVLNDSEHAIIHSLGFISYKPTLVLTAKIDITYLLNLILEKAGMMFFYTSGPQEVHAWLIAKEAPAVTCASKIHSDLARGFIKAEIIHYDKLISAHSFNEARALGLTQLVDKNHAIPDGTVLEIRFKV